MLRNWCGKGQEAIREQKEQEAEKAKAQKAQADVEACEARLSAFSRNLRNDQGVVDGCSNDSSFVPSAQNVIDLTQTAPVPKAKPKPSPRTKAKPWGNATAGPNYSGATLDLFEGDNERGCFGVGNRSHPRTYLSAIRVRVLRKESPYYVVDTQDGNNGWCVETSDVKLDPNVVLE